MSRKWLRSWRLMVLDRKEMQEDSETLDRIGEFSPLTADKMLRR